MVSSIWHQGAVEATAALCCALAISVLLVATKGRHGHLTLDSTVGVQKFHAEPTPRVGGLAIYLGLLLAWSLAADPRVKAITGVILLAGLFPLVCGLAEDLTKRVGVLPRLLATMGGGIAACLISGVCLNRVDVYGVDQLLAVMPLAVIFTAFAVGGVANAINIIDGFHGLASGTTMVALIALAVISARVHDLQLAVCCLLVAAAVTGFWLVNYPWGKLFMGDGGAYFSGFALAWLAVLLPVRNPGVSAWAGLLVCAYPVIEVLYSVGRRAIKQQSPGTADNGHLHSLIKIKLVRPRLAARGVGRHVGNAAVSPIVWAFSAVPSIAATALFDRPAWLVGGVALSAAAYHFLYKHLAGKPEVEHLGVALAQGAVAARYGSRPAVHREVRRRRRSGVPR